MHRLTPWLPPLLATTLALAAGCTNADSGDGAGTPDEPPTWRLEGPVAQVGHAPGQELDRVYGGVLRADGSLVLGNSGTAELRWFDPDGQPRRTAGRRGAGPGEFGSINWIGQLPGDSLIAFDMRHQRFSVWDSAGTFARTFTSRTPPGPLRPVGVFSDGTLLVVVEGQYDPRGGAGVVRDSLRVARIGRNGEVVRQLGSLAGSEWLVYAHPTSFRATQLPFGPSGHLALVRDHVVYGSSDGGRLTVLDGDGRVARTMELPVRAGEVSRDALSAALAGIEDRAERSALAAHYRDAPVRAPVFTALRADGDGNLWVRLFPRPGAQEVPWVVLSPEGERLGTVRLRESAHILDGRGDRLVVRESDGDGVQSVAVLTLRR